ncbi:MAG: 23S rRNA (pseudouridine(1915)-N(3))-methyltransferase RlmH [Anaerovoracaceae bacterium]|nr:23S rRNA (pseudouridine(1915)-N(3))-methyltransferase RlmH [Anaerovoracaceae bacterium]
MNIRILCIGKMKETYWREASKEYEKRLSKYCSLTIIELKEDSSLEKEGEDILKRLKEDDFVIALDMKGQQLTSEGLARRIESLAIEGKSKLVLVIGGSDGLSQEVLWRANLQISFSKLTFPHQMIRIFLLEQLYRSFKIIKGETYHK